MTVTGTAACGSVTDVMNLTVTEASNANASGDWMICEDEASYTIVGASSGGGTVNCTTSGDGFCVI